MLSNLIIALAIATVSPQLWAEDASFQRDIDSAVQEIMLTGVGQTICRQILGGQADAIQIHLGVSATTAQAIAQNCSSTAPANVWIFPTSVQDIRKLTVGTFKPRKYLLLSAETVFPIESWTDPFTNTTVLMSGREGISHERLVQLLAHEMAVYFDSKANPAHPDAQSIPEIRALKLQAPAGLNPLIAASDPLIAHTMTFVRALQVEYSIVDDLIRMHKIIPPADHDNPYLQTLVSDQCQEECLEKLVTGMHDKFLPIGLPLLAFSPYFRSRLPIELANLPGWPQDQWPLVQRATVQLPVDFLKTQFTGNPLADLQRVFTASVQPTPEFTAVSDFITKDLWPLERTAITQTSTGDGRHFLEYMKSPLLSGYNISLSSGPRVRVGTGNTE
jgi:hypothetical protein